MPPFKTAPVSVFGVPIDPSARGRCAHDLRYRLVRMYDLLAIDPDGVAINVCDYCGADLNQPEETQCERKMN